MMSYNDYYSDGDDDYYGTGGSGSSRRGSGKNILILLLVFGLFFVGVGGGIWYVSSQDTDNVSFNDDNNDNNKNEEEEEDNDINIEESATLEIILTQAVSVTETKPPFTLTYMPPSVTSPPVAPRVGFMAPDFSLQSLAGKTVSLSSFRGKAVLINLWTSWCGPCLSEMPSIQKSYEIYGAEGYEVLAANLTYSDDLPDVESYIKSERFTFTILLDDTRFFRETYGFTGNIPTSFFIDRYGVIQYIQIGSMNEDWLFKNVEDLLAID